MRLHEYLADLDMSDYQQIIDDWLKFQRDGFIDDCLLRRVSKSYMATIQTDQNITWWMREIAFAVSLDLAYRRVSWSRGATEYQDNGIENIDTCQVYPREVTVTEYVTEKPS